MLKFVKHHMDSIAGIDIYPILSLLIFFTFFVVLTIFVYTSSKAHIKYMEEMPLDDNSIDKN